MQSLEFMRSLVTVLSFLVFVGIGVWAYAPRRKSRFRQDAQIPFNDDEAQEGRLQ
ncbi:MAG TPA: cbb3-type cytochrome c oxidase subunit 3 [Burkholderiaceae bacterium]|nr:cbb3-type cytochrome c oxidase subunit 3 [Burkholderiaceae bacterium]